MEIKAALAIFWISHFSTLLGSIWLPLFLSLINIFRFSSLGAIVKSRFDALPYGKKNYKAPCHFKAQEMACKLHLVGKK